MISKTVRTDTRKLARQAWGNDESCRFWCGSELDERIKRHPEVLAEFFDLGSQGKALPDPEIEAYRAWASQRYRGLHLIGLGGGDVKVRVDEVYVPLRISHRPELDFDLRTGKRRGDLARSAGSGDIELEKIFDPELNDGHALIFGDPGAGKTTALLKLLNQACTEGPESLRLAEDAVALFLPLRRLANADLDAPLDVHLRQQLPERFGALVTRLWQRGRLVLLLDGLDEIGDDQRRQEVCAYLDFQLAGDERRGIRAVISCRYAGYGGSVKLAGRFLHLDVQPLDAQQVRELVQLWFRKVQPLIADYREGDARRPAEALIAALEGVGYSSQQLKVLVSSPLLLTLLCVVVLRGGEMPRHRVTFYDQCLRVLLSKWSQATKGIEPLLDVETALAVLRPLAWRLHIEGRRDDVSKAYLLTHLRQRLRHLAPQTSPFRVLEWLHRATGVIDEYAPLRYGFMHLGLQEYLAAAHVASRGEGLLDQLVERFGERWWREVILLLLGLPGQAIFTPFLQRLLASDAPLAHPELLRAGLSEAPEVVLGPFLEALDQTSDPARQAAILRMLRGRCDDPLIARAREWVDSDHPDLKALARQAVAECSGAASRGDRTSHDLAMLYLPGDAAAAAELTARLERQGLRLLSTSGWEADLETIIESVQRVAVLVGAGELPWEHRARRECLEYLAGDGLQLIPVGLPGGELPTLPSTVAWAPWVDASAGLETEAVATLGRWALEPSSGAAALTGQADTAAEHRKLLVEPRTGMRFVWVPGGRFRMGGTRHDDEKPQHWIRISPFWLGETPVTNAEYAAFLEQTRHPEPAQWRNRDFAHPEQPVVGASWHDAKAFCAWLSESMQETARLPSEAQWEFAARGVDDREYPWGNEPPDESRACFGLDWESDHTARVRMRPAGAGPFGTLDQAGNVWEWCQDVWDEAAYRKRAGREPLDPLVTEGEAGFRVLRGGGWDGSAGILRAACRLRSLAADRGRYIGFRVLAAPSSP
ncbi:MAG: SUMF1/EgtB/PvdO family nonheme iron enzyme [Acidobacteriota bacterium]